MTRTKPGYLSLQVIVPQHSIDQITAIIGTIPEESPIVTEPHITLLYGFGVGTNVENISAIIEQLKIPPILFHTEFQIFKRLNMHDVLVARFDDVMIHNAHHRLTELPHSLEFDIYRPHMTIQYIENPITNHQRTRLCALEPIQVVPHRFKFKDTSGEITYFGLGQLIAFDETQNEESF